LEKRRAVILSTGVSPGPPAGIVSDDVSYVKRPSTLIRMTVLPFSWLNEISFSVPAFCAKARGGQERGRRDHTKNDDFVFQNVLHFNINRQRWRQF